MSKEYQFKAASAGIASRFNIVPSAVSGSSVDKVMERVFGTIRVCDRYGFDEKKRQELESTLIEGGSSPVEFCVHPGIPGKRSDTILIVGQITLVPNL